MIRGLCSRRALRPHAHRGIGDPVATRLIEFAGSLPGGERHGASANLRRWVGPRRGPGVTAGPFPRPAPRTGFAHS